MPVFTQKKYNIAYDISSYGSENPNYVKIMVDESNLGTYEDLFKHHEELDPINKNTAVGSESCEVVNLCVPSIHVPDVTRQLVADSIDKTTGKPSDLDYKVADEVRLTADSILNLPDENLATSEPFHVGDILFGSNTDTTELDYTKHKAINAEDLPDKDFSNIAKTSQTLVTNDSIPCREDTAFTIPTIDPNSWKDKEYQDLLDKLKDLMDDDVEPEVLKTSVTNKDLTERIVDGHGTFDWIASAIFNQLAYVKNQGLISNDDIAQVYTQALNQGLQMAVQFTLERDKTHLLNLAQLAQIKTANVQALMAKAELLMLPSKMELAYAQLEVQRRQIDLLNYQIEVQKAQIPKEYAQLDQIKAQTDLVCTQRKLALEQLAQAELDRKMKQAQIETAVLGIKATSVDIQIKEHQADQAEIATQASLVQLEGTKEEVKIKNTQWQLGLQNIRLAKAQHKQLAADLKLKAQQLLKDREQVALIKAQTATAYAQVTATSEAIKAAQAQYSDTINGKPVGGVLGAQIAVNKMQAEAFDRDSFYKFATTVSDGWKAKKTADIATLSPNAYTAFGVDRVFARYAQYFHMPVNTFELPPNYTDYLTDEEMDGTAPTPSTSKAVVKP